MSCNVIKSLALGLALAALPQLANAAVINATSAAVVNDSTDGVGSHYHLAPGNAAGVNSYDSEEGRGVAEFDLTGLAPFTAATLSFRVAGYADIYNYEGGSLPFVTPITLRAYNGDNAIAFSDFQIATYADIDSFGTTGLAIGDVLTFDVTAELLAALGTSFGVLFDGETVAGEERAIVFDQIKIVTDEGSAVPEPMTLALLGAGLLGLGMLRRRARRD